MNSDLILLDEPMSGLTPSMIGKMLSHISLAKESSKTILVIEHNLPIIMNLCEKSSFLDHGQKLPRGRLLKLEKDAQVIQVYWERVRT